MYSGEVRKARSAWMSRERMRQDQIRTMYRERVGVLHGYGSSTHSAAPTSTDALGNLVEFTPPPTTSNADAPTETWQQQAA
jgi:hypothetical protein